MNRNALFNNVLSLEILQILSYVFTLFVHIYLVRVIGLEKYGLVFFVFSFVQFFIILCDYGFDLSATSEIAVNRHNKNNISNIFNSVFILKVVLLLISFLILFVCVSFIDRFEQNKILFMGASGMVISSVLFPIWFFQGMEKMQYISILQIFSQLLLFVLTFLFVRKESDFIYVPILNSFCSLFFSLIALYFVKMKFKVCFYIPKYKSIKKQFMYSSEFFLSKISLSSLSNINTLCLGFVANDVIVGFYVSAEKIYSVLKSVWMPIHNTFYPYMAKNKDLNLYKKLLKYIVLINSIICFFVYQNADNIINLFFGTQMQESIPILRIFSIILFITIPSIMFGYPLLGTMVGAKGFKIVNWSIIVSTLFYFIGLLILFFYKQLNMYSIVYLILYAEVFVFVYRLFSVIKYNIFMRDKNEKI